MPASYYLVLAVIGLLGAVMFFASRPRSAGRADPAQGKPADMYLGLRSRMLATTARTADIKPEPGKTVAYGVVLDLALASGTATIVSLATGDTSMYTSTGGGIIGGIGHESCRAASRQFIAVAQGFLGQMTRATEFPLPPPGVFRFYVLTTDGIFTAEDTEAALTQKKGPLFPLFFAGDNVITQIRLTAPKS